MSTTLEEPQVAEESAPIEDQFPLPSEEYHQLLLRDIGKVKWSPEEAKKPYGIIETEQGDVLFYPSHLRCWASDDSGQLQLIPVKHRLNAGDFVTLSIEQREKGLRATHVVRWSIPHLQKALNGESKVPRYRLVRYSGEQTASKLHRSKPYREEVLWEGTDLDELRSRFPAEQYPVRSRNFTDVRLSIELKSLKTGEWKKSRDPRR